MPCCSAHLHPCTVMPGTKLQEHSGSDKAWVWSTIDFAEEEQKMELFCMRFANAERMRGAWLLDNIASSCAHRGQGIQGQV